MISLGRSSPHRIEQGRQVWRPCLSSQASNWLSNRRRLSHLLQCGGKRFDSMVNLLLGDDQRRLEAQDIAEGSAQAYQDATT
jgi:hypothetical protein